MEQKTVRPESAPRQIRNDAISKDPYQFFGGELQAPAVNIETEWQEKSLEELLMVIEPYQLREQLKADIEAFLKGKLDENQIALLEAKLVEQIKELHTKQESKNMATVHYLEDVLEKMAA